MHSKSFPDCFYRVSVKGLCVRDGKVLLIRESSSISGKWELPGGGLDFGEDIKQALKREVFEEMNIKVTHVSDQPIYIWTHRYENNRRNIGWYYSLVLAYQIEIDSLDFVPSEECEAIGFFSKEEMQTLEFNGQTAQLAKLFDPAHFKDK